MPISEAEPVERPIRSISAPTAPAKKQNSTMDPDHTAVAIVEIPGTRYLAHVSIHERDN
jgi:hypothetical protein